MGLYKLCKCGKRIDYILKACDECVKAIDKDTKDKYNKYRENRTDTKEQKFYNSKKWKTKKEEINKRDNYLCQHCLSNSKMVSADLVHHIVELKFDFNLGLEDNNLICLCNQCHSKIHKAYENKSKKEKIVEELKKIVDKDREGTEE